MDEQKGREVSGNFLCRSCKDEWEKEEPELGKRFLQMWREKKAETEAFAGHEEEKDSGPRTKEQLLAEINHLRERLGKGEGENVS